MCSGMLNDKVYDMEKRSKCVDIMRTFTVIVCYCITISLRLKGWTFIIYILPPLYSVTEYFLNQASWICQINDGIGRALTNKVVGNRGWCSEASDNNVSKQSSFSCFDIWRIVIYFTQIYADKLRRYQNIGSQDPPPHYIGSCVILICAIAQPDCTYKYMQFTIN